MRFLIIANVAKTPKRGAAKNTHGINSFVEIITL